MAAGRAVALGVTPTRDVLHCAVIKLVCKQIPHAIPRYIAGMIYGDLTK